MSMDGLFSTSREFRDDFHRNIVSLRESEDLFDDINDGDPALSSLAQRIDISLKANIPTGTIQRGFFYSAPLQYPFTQITASRYSDGSFGVLYGSLDMETTVYETVHHMIRYTLGIEGIAGDLTRERAVYLVHCNAILLDLTDRGTDYPELLSDDYTFTQQIGKRVSSEGHPGLLVPSARTQHGVNTVIFNPDILSNERINCYLIYRMSIPRRVVSVEREPGVTWLEIGF
jgi:hypothetical protein